MGKKKVMDMHFAVITSEAPACCVDIVDELDGKSNSKQLSRIKVKLKFRRNQIINLLHI